MNRLILQKAYKLEYGDFMADGTIGKHITGSVWDVVYSGTYSLANHEVLGFIKQELP